MVVMPVELLVFGSFSAIVLSCVLIVFAIAQVWRDNSVMDIAYGAIFAVATWGTLFFTQFYTLHTVVVAVLVTLWAVRLSLRILRKNWGRPEDARYAAWRTQWMSRGYGYFVMRSLLQINLLQGAIIIIVSAPLILAIASAPYELTWPLFAGTLLVLIGLGFETTADWQLDAFIARKRAGTETAPLMKTGLFQYSRRPNYFGESLIWWGFAITTLATPYWYLGFISPLLITYIVTKVTGPILERQFLKTYPVEYRQYMVETNYFVPGPKRNSGDS